MKFNRNVWVIFFVGVCVLFSLRGKEHVAVNEQEVVKPNTDFSDPKVLTQQIEDVLTFNNRMDVLLGPVAIAYDKKHDPDFAITCKNCKKDILTLWMFSGYLQAWLLKAIADGHEVFEDTKKLVDQFIALLSRDASEEELINFMLKTMNNKKRSCVCCKETEWEIY